VRHDGIFHCSLPLAREAVNLASCFSCGVARAEIDDASKKYPCSLLRPLCLPDCDLRQTALPCFHRKLSEVLISQLTVRFAVFINADASMHKWYANESKAILDYQIRVCLDNSHMSSRQNRAFHIPYRCRYSCTLV
jgi:hypothetical protein